MIIKISLRNFLYFSIAIIAFGLIGFIIWANTIYSADQNKLNLIIDKQDVSIIEKDSYWQISPRNCDSSCTNGLIYYPGAKVDPRAYFYKL